MTSVKAAASQDQSVEVPLAVVEVSQDRSPAKTVPQRIPVKVEVENIASPPQNQPTLYESATIIQTTPASLKSKKFPKLSQKQRRINSTRCDSTSASHEEVNSRSR